mmetsp:Transcript_2357/g.3363  ORF Transcript_2357/g.3363 Transcript_2357/m.3363 type:complete len:212 (-) Transcript_2357:946-1581(-)
MMYSVSFPFVVALSWHKLRTLKATLSSLARPSPISSLLVAIVSSSRRQNEESFEYCVLSTSAKISPNLYFALRVLYLAYTEIPALCSISEKFSGDFRQSSAKFSGNFSGHRLCRNSEILPAPVISWYTSADPPLISSRGTLISHMPARSRIQQLSEPSIHSSLRSQYLSSNDCTVTSSPPAFFIFSSQSFGLDISNLRSTSISIFSLTCPD